MKTAFVYSGVRTPFGKYRGGLTSIRPDDLAASVIATMLDRAPDLNPERVDEVVFGNANGAGEENRCVARMAWLLAGQPTSVPATTLNRLCGSSLDAVMSASRMVETGDADLVLTGGVESMSRAPWVLPKTERPYPSDDLTLSDTALGWRLVNPRMPGEWTVSLGEATEQLAARLSIDRGRQDEFALRSHRCAHEAWNAGKYAGLVVSPPGVALERDEAIRADTDLDRLAQLPPVFRRPEEGGTITPGNASPLSDGASALWIGTEAAATLLGRDPVARLVARAAAANDPRDFGIAPVRAAERALEQAGRTWSDIGAVELNEAFAAQSLACLDAWGIDATIVNAWGGAISIGHPLGASGTRILDTLAARLLDSGARYGLAAICVGVGQGLAVVLENVSASAS